VDSEVRAAGERQGATLAVSRLEQAGTPAAEPQGLPAGQREVAVVLVNFQNDTSQPFTASQARSVIFTNPNSVSAYYAEQSVGSVSLTGKLRPDGDVFGWYTIPSSNNPCNYFVWAGQAFQAAIGAGVNLSDYDHYIYIWPSTNACPFGGAAFTPGSLSYINGALTVNIIGHEIGHNLGLPHASSLQCVDAAGLPVPYSSTCAEQEYGDWFSIMGIATPRHNHNQHKTQLGFLPIQNTVTAPPGTHSYTLAPSEQPIAAANQVVRVPRTVSPNEGVIDYYYLDFRQPFGVYFDAFAPADPAVNGVTIRVAPDYDTIANSFLLDMHPETPLTNDAPLATGLTFTDPVTGTTVTTLGVAPSGATVEVTVGSDSDGDGLYDATEPQQGTDPQDGDSDNDGCLDGSEVNGTAPFGGDRNPLYFWDFFDTPATGSPVRDRVVSAGDIGGVVARFGAHRQPPLTKEQALTEALSIAPPPSPAYHAAFDRTGSSGGPVNLQPPDGAISASDIGAVVAQFGTSCALP
jgi:hypothetical protein